MSLSRRTMLAGAAALPLFAKFLKSVGAQLDTVRAILEKDPSGTLAALEKIGYREVEVSWAQVPLIWESLQKTRLKPVSVHADAELFEPGREAGLEAVIAQARERRFEYLVYPTVPASRRGGLDAFERLAERLNLAGAICRKAGLHLCYHNHAFEFKEGERRVPIDLLMGSTEEKLVSLELDVFWVSVAGFDPVAMLRRYDGRVPLIHLNDKAAGFPVQYDESVPRGVFKEVGAGALDFPALLAAADKAGVRHYFVKQDQTPGDPLRSLARSYDYLARLRF